MSMSTAPSGQPEAQPARSAPPNAQAHNPGPPARERYFSRARLISWLQRLGALVVICLLWW